MWELLQVSIIFYRQIYFFIHIQNVYNLTSLVRNRIMFKLLLGVLLYKVQLFFFFKTKPHEYRKLITIVLIYWISSGTFWNLFAFQIVKSATHFILISKHLQCCTFYNVHLLVLIMSWLFISCIFSRIRDEIMSRDNGSLHGREFR